MTPNIRLVKLLSNMTLVGAVCRMFGANIYARIRVVHALGYVMLMALRYLIYLQLRAIFLGDHWIDMQT